MTENNEHLALWGGRFTSGPSPELARLSKSTQFDWRLADDDIAGSRAHARALGRAGLLTADELQRMEDALDTLQRHVDDGSFAPIEDDEDEATALERGLIDIEPDSGDRARYAGTHQVVLDQNAGHLAVSDINVVRPLDPRLDSERIDRIRNGQRDGLRQIELALGPQAGRAEHGRKGQIHPFRAAP